MFKCEICRTTSKPGTPRQVWTLYREKDYPREGSRGLEPRREITVCHGCYSELASGEPLGKLIAHHELIRRHDEGLPASYNRPVEIGQAAQVVGGVHRAEALKQG